MRQIFMSHCSTKIVLPLLLVAILSGCGKNSSNGTTGSLNSSAVNGATIIPTPSGNGLSYSFTASSTYPVDPGTNQPIRRFLAGVLPFGHQNVGGSCGAQYNFAQDGQSPGTYFLSFCNARRMQPSMPNEFFGQQVFGNNNGFGSVVAGLTSLPGMTSAGSKLILGYEYDGMSSVSMSKFQQIGVPCPSVYQQLGFTSPTACAQIVVSGVLTLSPSYIQENMLGNAQVSRIALDLSPLSLGGTIFVISPVAGASNIVTF